MKRIGKVYATGNVNKFLKIQRSEGGVVFTPDCHAMVTETKSEEAKEGGGFAVFSVFRMFKKKSSPRWGSFGGSVKEVGMRAGT